MKNTILHYFARKASLLFAITLLGFAIQSESFGQLATYPLRTANAVNNNTPQGTAQVSLTNPNVNPGTLVSGANMLQDSYNGTGYRVKTNNVPSWATSLTDGFGFDVPIAPKAGFDMNMTGLTLDVTYIDFDVTGSYFTIVPYFQIDGAGPWLPLTPAQTVSTISTVNFGTINETFYSGHNYVVRFYIFNSDGNTAAKNDEMRIMNLSFKGTTYQPIALPTNVTTISAAATGKYTATATGSYLFNGTQYYLVKKSGMIWSSTSAAALALLDTSAKTKTIDGNAGVINSNITGLSAGTDYWVRAYIVTQFGIQYGATFTFKTDAPSAPVVTTNAVTNVLSNKATGGGAIVDSGGVAITSKGMVWNLSGGATLASNAGKVVLNGGSASFSDFMKGLAPGTKYCYRAFATNSIGTSYGNDVCFTTAAAVPVLVAVPGSIDFGENFYGSNAITVSYTLSGSNLTPASGNITISIPAAAGFKISLTSSGGFGTTLTLPYTGGALPRTPIFVQFPTGAYGSFTGVITHSGGGVAVVDADVVNVKGVIVQSPDAVTNSGSDFWLGFGYQNKMIRVAGSGAEPYLTVYVAAGSQAANVTVEMPGIAGGGYPQSVTVPANSTRAFTNFPQGAIAGVDARLLATGVSSKGIHVYSTNGAPISVWEYIATTGNSAAGAMIFPTSTWNSNYTVQAYAGKSNNGLPNSFFFVIANEDDTKVTITPSSGIISAAGALIDNPPVQYPANVPFTVTLNRGQVFNAIGVITGTGNAATSTGYDLSGTKVSTICDKKIAVFGGNGRCMVTTPTSCTEAQVSAGSDNMIQQMIPSVAWDTKYFTVPTKTMERNLFRIYVRNNTQSVWINDEAHGAASKLGAGGNGTTFNGSYTFTAFTNGGGFYALETNNPLEIESDEPISVTQFITAGDCGAKGAIGNNGQGDPEMIILTGAQQAINSAVVYSPSFQNGATGGGYINVVIPKAGVTTFKLDNVASVDTGSSSYTGAPYGGAPLIPIANAFKPYPNNPNYYWAKFRVSYPTTHTMSSTVPFNAIAYGVANGESYGFNAGTAVKNLSSYKISVNPIGGDSSSTVIRTCVNTPITLKIAFPYNPTLVDRIVWEPNDARVSPNTIQTGPIASGKAVYDGTIDIGGRTFYVYTSPSQYTFSENALFRFKVTAFGTFASDCPGEDQQTMLVNVGQDNLNLRANPSCNNPTVPFTADTIPMVGTNILSWNWDFGDGTTLSTGAITPQSHTYPSSGATAYTVKLTTKNTVGCYSTDSLLIDFGGGLTSAFTISDDAVCANDNVTFTDASYGTGTSGSPNSWVWDFSDGKTSNAQTPPAQSWATPGIKTIALTVTTPIGCVKTFKDTVTVEATPVAVIDANPTFVCLGSDASYKDKSTISIGTIASWLWTFDDGTTSTDQNPVKRWATAGSHTVTLTVKSAGDCAATNTATHTINVNAAPLPGFKYDLNCTTRTISFTDTSNGFGTAINKWTWDFGDGTPVSAAQNPSHIYAAAGTYTITFSVTTANGCNSVAPITKTITIAASPVADFTLPGNTCLPNASAAFTNATTISDGTIATMTYAWDFGDAGTATDKDPTHIYTATGNYTVKLTATSVNGCTNTISKAYSAIFAAPVAAIGNIAEVCAGATATLSSAGSTAAGSTVTGWAWDFGDGTAASTDQNPAHIYATAGSYTVSLTVSSAAGCTSAATTKTATVNALPTADFTSGVNCTTRSVDFTDASVPNSGAVNQWTWSFGDGGTSTQQNPTHQYASEGNFTVTLSVKTDKGCSSSVAVSKTITIAAAPVVEFDLPGNLCLPNASGTFTNKTTISDGTIAQVTYLWDLGDATTSTDKDPLHTYAATGPFTIKLTATSNQGCISSATKSYNSVYAQPVAVITAPAGVCLGNNTSFSSTQSTAPASSVTGWDWNFGDGGTSADQSPVYVFAAAGNKTVTLIVTSAAGCASAPASQSFDVNLSPVPNFTFSAIRCKDSVITFTDASTSNATGGITEYKWTFGDGGSLTQTALAPATHTFTGAQSYTVSLELKNANGCLSAAAYSVPVVINPNPVSNFTVADICIPSGLAQFTQSATVSSGSVAGWNWDFGDGNGFSNISPNPSFTYTTGGEYQVTLKATTDNSCAALFTAPVKAYNVPTPSFTVTNPSGSLCSNLPVSFTDQSVVTGYGTVSKIEIYWDYLNDPTAKEVINAPSANGIYPHQYTEFGTPATKTYRLLVRAFSGNGCTADYYQDIDLLASPKVAFTQPAPVCQEEQPFNLTGASDTYGLPGSGEYSGSGITASPEFSPSAAGFGSHNIRYTYTTLTGCTNFMEKELVVNPTPVIDFGGPEINVLEGDIMNLSPSITYGSTYLWTPSTYLDNPASPKPSGLPTNDITYTLNVTSDKGCVAETSVFIRVVRNYIVPNTFTPNHDNIHDSWEIANLKFYPSVRVRVYNRSGQLVHENIGYNTPWDGTYKGKDMPFGTYYYVIETGGGRKPRTGYVTILK